MKANIESFEWLTKNTFFMKVRPEEKVAFKAGQFMMIKAGGDEKPFSIASFPGEETIDFLISVHLDGTVTPKLAKMKKGSALEIEGPYGVFTVGDTTAKEIVFVAAGTGIAPFRSMIMDALQRFPKKKIKLMFGFRENFYFEKYWRELEHSYSNFKLCLCCSAPKGGWTGRAGRVTACLEEEIKDAKDKEVYVCGLPVMVADTREILEKKLGFSHTQIHVEKW